MVKAIILDWNGVLNEKGKGLYSGAEEAVRRLDGRYRLGLVTKGGQERWDEIGASGLMRYFDFVSVSREKKAAEYAACIDDLEVLPEEAAVVDDRVIYGIKHGNALGCKTVWLRRGKYADELPDDETGRPDYTIGSLGELIGLLP